MVKGLWINCFLYRPQNYKKFPLDLQENPPPYLNEFYFPGKDESTKLKYCAVLLV